MQIGYYPYICPTCDEDHEADLFPEDIKRGWVMGFCYRTGGSHEIELNLPELPERVTEIISRHNNLPDDMQDTVRGMF